MTYLNIAKDHPLAQTPIHFRHDQNIEGYKTHERFLIRYMTLVSAYVRSPVYTTTLCLHQLMRNKHIYSPDGAIPMNTQFGAEMLTIDFPNNLTEAIDGLGDEPIGILTKNNILPQNPSTEMEDGNTYPTGYNIL